MRLPGSPWFYNEAELACFVEKEMDKHEDELCKLYRNDKDAFAKKIRGIVIGTWQKNGAYGRETRANMDKIINGAIDFANIKYSVLCEE